MTSIVPFFIQLVYQSVLSIAVSRPRPCRAVGCIDTIVAAPGRQASAARRREDDEQILVNKSQSRGALSMLSDSLTPTKEHMPAHML